MVDFERGGRRKSEMTRPCSASTGLSQLIAELVNDAAHAFNQLNSTTGHSPKIPANLDTKPLQEIIEEYRATPFGILAQDIKKKLLGIHDQFYKKQATLKFVAPTPATDTDPIFEAIRAQLASEPNEVRQYVIRELLEFAFNPETKESDSQIKKRELLNITIEFARLLPRLKENLVSSSLDQLVSQIRRLTVDPVLMNALLSLTSKDIRGANIEHLQNNLGGTSSPPLPNKAPEDDLDLGLQDL